MDSPAVMPAQAGIQYFSGTLDSRLRGNDNQGQQKYRGYVGGYFRNALANGLLKGPGFGLFCGAGLAS
ncbi:MAG: hypothetical protein NTY44_02650, partial [Deltaproteobacteria bacterium]|nr:hypothetical protein [Deltaproteobacteria bacterium]